MKQASSTRREFLTDSLTLAAGLAVSASLPAAAAEGEADMPPFTMTRISGTPRERGRQYGQTFSDSIRGFLDREVYAAFEGRPSAKRDMLRYADQCARAIAEYSPTLIDELEGMAEGSGLSLPEHVLLTLHEELWHKGELPSVEHCTAIAAGPPDTSDGHAYVGQTWDWMDSVFGLSTLLDWRRPEGPSVLAYSFPGLWVGAGMNSSGLALTWTSGFGGKEIKSPRVGIPSYALIAQMLYQESLEDALEEARRARHAGWFTFVLGDAEGRLANVEGNPEELAVERHEGRLARVLFGSRQITGASAEEPIPYHERCQRMYDLLEESAGEINATEIQRLFGSSCGIAHGGTLDAMIFDCTARTAWLSRVRGEARNWQSFSLES